MQVLFVLVLFALAISKVGAESGYPGKATDPTHLGHLTGLARLAGATDSAQFGRKGCQTPGDGTGFGIGAHPAAGRTFQNIFGE